MNLIHTIFDNSSDAVFGVNSAGLIKYTSSKFEKLLDYPQHLLLDRYCSEIICRTNDQGINSQKPHPILKAINFNDSISDFDLAINNRNGESLLVNIGVCHIPNSNHDEASIFFSLRHIDSKKLMNHMRLGSAYLKQQQNIIPEEMPLTRTEHKILGLASNGLNTDDIASKLSITRQTVRNHFKNIYPKIGVHSRAEAVSFAFRMKLV